MTVHMSKLQVSRPVAAMVGMISCHAAGVFGVKVEIEPRGLKVSIRRSEFESETYHVDLQGCSVDRLAEIDHAVVAHAGIRAKRLENAEVQR